MATSHRLHAEIVFNLIIEHRKVNLDFVITSYVMILDISSGKLKQSECMTVID